MAGQYKDMNERMNFIIKAGSIIFFSRTKHSSLCINAEGTQHHVLELSNDLKNS